MLHANHLTVVRHDNSHIDYTDVRYTLTADALQILDADGTETNLPTHDVLTTHAHAIHHPQDAR